MTTYFSYNIPEPIQLGLFDLEKFGTPDVAHTFQATTGGNFAPLNSLMEDETLT